MKREVVRDFLNLAGIAGIALMDGRSRPYFCGIDQFLNFQQKEALSQGIRQVVETTPEDFESFEFQFVSHQVYIYKLNQGVVLLVVAHANLVHTEYLAAIQQLRQGLEEDLTKAIATFRILASEVTGTNQNVWKQSVETISNRATVPAKVDNGTRTLPVEPFPVVSQGLPAPISHPVVSPTQLDVAPVSVPPAAEPAIAPVELKELLTAINSLSQFTTQYLGNAVITNYWKASRPEHEWLKQFQIDRAAQITFANSAQPPHQDLTLEQQQWLREWVARFIERCAKVIRDFPVLVHQSALSDRQRTLLLN